MTVAVFLFVSVVPSEIEPGELSAFLESLTLQFSGPPTVKVRFCKDAGG